MVELYMLCTTFCLLPFTTCLPVCLLCTTFEEGGTSIPMKGFSCSMGGEGALLTLEGPEADLAHQPHHQPAGRLTCNLSEHEREREPSQFVGLV